MYKLLAIGALYVVQPIVLKRMKRRMMEREVVKEAERITLEDAQRWS